MTDEENQAAEAANTNSAEAAAADDANTAAANDGVAAASTTGNLSHLKEEFNEWMCAAEREADDIIAWFESKI